MITAIAIATAMSTMTAGAVTTTGFLDNCIGIYLSTTAAMSTCTIPATVAAATTTSVSMTTSV